MIVIVQPVHQRYSLNSFITEKRAKISDKVFTLSSISILNREVLPKTATPAKLIAIFVKNQTSK